MRKTLVTVASPNHFMLIENVELITAYKLFRVRKDGTIGSLFINRKALLIPGEWNYACSHPTKGFAFRPGWHSTSWPYAPHLSMKGRAWFKVLIGNYETIKRPKSQGGTWYLSKWMRIVERLDF